MIYSTETIQIMTNETKPKIKELLKEVGNNSIITLDDPPLKVKDTPEYRQLKQAIKQLRKENKKLKKELNMGHVSDTRSGLVGFGEAPVYAPSYKDYRTFTKIARDIIQKDTPQLVVEFKCAKTHKPSKVGLYPVIINGLGGLYYVIWHWSDSEPFHESVLAFIEADPQEIINSLNK